MQVLILKFGSSGPISMSPSNHVWFSFLWKRRILYSLIFIFPCWETGLHHTLYTLKWKFFVSYLFLYISCQARQGDCIFTRWISWPVDGNWIDGWWTLHHIYFRCILRSATFNRQRTLQLYVGIPKPIVKFLHHGLKCKKQDFLNALWMPSLRICW